MKKSREKSVLARSKRRRSHREVGTTAGCAIFLAASGVAMGQDAGAGANESMDEVVVTGLRKSIEDSIAVKKENSSIVEVVSAEDIGKLPDASIAEAIGRLPGIAAQRTNGRAQTLSIRGLGPDFTVTTFNGREQASTNDNRTVEFDQYPSELVTQVRIYKTPDAGMAYQGIAGTTDIATVHPLAMTNRKLAFGYKREVNEQDANIPGLPDAGDRVNGTYIDQFMDGRLGVALGIAYNKTPYQAQTREPWGYPATCDTCDPLVIGGDKDGVQSSYYKRTAYMGVVEFQPNDQLHMLLDAYHSDFREVQTIQRMEFGTVWSGATLTNPGPVENGRVQSGEFPNVPFMVIENYNNDRHANVDAIGLNTEVQFNDNWNMNVDLSWSSVDRDDLRLESTAGLGTMNDPDLLPPTESISFTTGKNGITYFTPSLNYSDYGSVFLTDPGGWGGGARRAGFVGAPEISDEIQAIRVAATRKFDESFFLSDVTFGVNYADRTKAKNQFQSNLWLTGDISHAVVPEEFRTGIADSSFFGSPYGIIGYDALAMYRAGFWQPINSVDDPAANPNDRINNVMNTWQVDEKLTTAFVRFGFDAELDGLPLRGNIGVQTITADQTSHLHLTSSVIPENTAVLPIDVVNEGDKYTDILPSLNLSLDFPNEYKLRFAAAATVARPRLDDLGGGASYTTISDQGVAKNYNGELYYWERTSGGNPKLKPWRANAIDLSLEKYFGSRAYVSAAVYYKDLKTYITNETTIEDFSEASLPPFNPQDPNATYELADANRLGASTLKVNGSGGYVKGVEFTASVPFSLFAEPLDGFGFIVSAAKNSSSIKINGEEVPIPGLSTKVINSTLYYEKYGFSARVSNRYRDDFIGEVPAFDATLTLNNVSAESLLDAQIGYTFQTGVLNGLSINLSGTNLTDEPFVLNNLDTTPYNLIKYQNYGAVYALAVNYVFQ
ncbi:MAG TPA: TonB-dependent receptor [Steroidobacteraceae bacterium]|nr:TonB-dependent receptor [Steroidobacteraceae bacterium]